MPANKKNHTWGARLTIDLDALYKNASHLLEITDNGLIAVVKNDAYHFGIEKTIETFYLAGVRFFATTSLRDAIFIRKQYDDVDIFMLNPCREFDTLRSEEHTSELQSRQYLVCRLLLEKKKLPRSYSSPHSRCLFLSV